MAVTSQQTLLNLARATVNKELVEIVEVLDEIQILKDAYWLEANQLTGHIFTQRAVLPAGVWRELNEGIAAESSHLNQITEGIGLLEGHSKIDAELVKLYPNEGQFMLDEEHAFIEGLGQTFETAFFYGDLDSEPSAIRGLADRYNTPSTQGNVWDAGHTTDSACSSIFMIQWGPRKVALCYPRNSKTMGVERDYLGIVPVVSGTATVSQLVAHFTKYVMKAGIVVHDNRCVQRIGSIAASGTASIFDPDLVIKAKNQMLRGGEGAILYCSKAIKAQIMINAKDKPNVWHYTAEPYGDGMLESVLGMRVHVAEAIIDTENDI